MASKSDDHDFTIMLKEASKYFDAQIRSFDVFRDYGKTVLGTSSVLVSLFAIFGTNKIGVHGSIWYALIIVVIAILYGWLMFNSLLSSLPKTFHYPIEPTEKEYAKAFLNKKKKDILKQQLANYLNIIPKNEILIKQRKNMARFITLQLALIVIFILVVSLLPLIP
jgi:hypothetical protein